MSRYDIYKEVDLIWLDEIPKHWSLTKVKNIFEISKDLSYKENPTVLSLARDRIKIRNISNNEGQLAESYNNYNSVEVGDLLLNPMDLYSGANCNISQYSGVISPAYINLRSKQKICVKYFDYIFKKQYTSFAFQAVGKGVSLNNRWTLSNFTLLNYLIPIPPLSEQENIANYLDWKIGEIDKLIEVEKQKIEELVNYKIQKLANIYKNINVYKKIPLKRVSRIYSGKEIEDEAESGVPVYGSGKNIFKYTTKELLNGKYIIFGRKGTIGKPYKINGKFWIVDTAYAIKNNDLVLFDYLYYLLQILNWNEFVTNTVKPSIVANQILQVKMKIPSIEIQEKIVKNINLLEENIENTIKLSNKKNSLLIELKNSLISEVVTGQIDVRNVKIPERK